MDFVTKLMKSVFEAERRWRQYLQGNAVPDRPREGGDSVIAGREREGVEGA